jgi:hypothetical protein
LSVEKDIGLAFSRPWIQCIDVVAGSLHGASKLHDETKDSPMIYDNIEVDIDQSLGCIEKYANACCAPRVEYIYECDTFHCMNPRAQVSIIHMISSTSCNGKGA